MRRQCQLSTHNLNYSNFNTKYRRTEYGFKDTIYPNRRQLVTII